MEGPEGSPRSGGGKEEATLALGKAKRLEARADGGRVSGVSGVAPISSLRLTLHQARSLQL